jgi:hypothetical protein
MPKPMMRMAIVSLLAIFVAGGVHAASSHGSKGSRGGGHSVGGRSHRGSFHGGGGSRGMSSHGGGRSGGGRSHGGSSFRKGGGSHGMSSRGGGMFRGGNSHSGGGSSRHSVMGNRGGYFGGGSHGMTGMSRGGFFAGLWIAWVLELRGNRWAGSGRPRGDRMSAGNFFWAKQLGATERAFAHFEWIFLQWESFQRRPVGFRGKLWPRRHFGGPRFGTILLQFESHGVATVCLESPCEREFPLGR